MLKMLNMLLVALTLLFLQTVVKTAISVSGCRPFFVPENDFVLFLQEKKPDFLYHVKLVHLPL
jgi:hypothetical protein